MPCGSARSLDRVTVATDHGGIRAFHALLVNTFIANASTAVLMFALTFWGYLETRSVLATSLMGGMYMLLMAVLAVPFGGLVDRHHKKRIMVVAAFVSVAFFAVALLLYVLTPYPELVRLDRPWFWLLVTLVMLGCVVESIRGIALSTAVTLLVPSERRANANGLVGMAFGATFLVAGVFSGFAYAWLGLFWVIVIALACAVLTLVHLALMHIHEPQIVKAEGGAKPVNFSVAWVAVRAVPGLLGLIVFSTFNNLLGGVFMGLLDPYGLELMSVQLWSVLYGVSSLGFIAGGAWIAKFGLGSRPLRSLLQACVLMWLVSMFFAIRDSVPLLVVGIVLYMAIVPVMEAAEQTVLQRVVPFEKQGRVFGFAQAVEIAAAPLSAFIIGPIAQFSLIPYAESERGAQQIAWLLGEGEGRGIALVFVVASVVGLLITLAAFASAPYRRISASYAEGDVNVHVAEVAEQEAAMQEGADPDGAEVGSPVLVEEAVSPGEPRETGPTAGRAQ